MSLDHFYHGLAVGFFLGVFIMWVIFGMRIINSYGRDRRISEAWCFVFHKKYHTFTEENKFFCKKCKHHRII